MSQEELPFFFLSHWIMLRSHKMTQFLQYNDLFLQYWSQPSKVIKCLKLYNRRKNLIAEYVSWWNYFIWLFYPYLTHLGCQKKKQWVNPTLKNECMLKKFKAYAAYSKVKPFWIYITVNFFKTFVQMKIFFKAYLEHNNGAWVLVK